ncbi:unnamed protein product [marine sediment metagenome]|uniref:NAD(+)--protein-arginine ADP-ribosyltransferase n=1 Tax=marine sediment metagenome TaxID=412755 RepID=X1SBN4_9ZZZZ
MPKDKAIEQFIKDAKLKGKVFTPKEAEEIWKHVKAYSGGAYRDLRSYQMNPAKFIRLQKPEFVKVIKKIDNNLGEFFKYSAKYKKEGILYRGINIDERAFSAFKKGRIIDMGGTSSFSSSKDVAQNFGNAIFKVENKTGASIKHISFTSVENEVILAKDTKFKVLNVSWNKNKKIGEILLGEV